MKLYSIKSYFLKLFSKDNRTKLIICIGLTGMALIFLSELIPKKEEKSESENTNYSCETSDETENYKIQIQTELTQILSQIQGVGNCTVMVTVEGTTEYVYAENSSRYTDQKDGYVSDKYENDIVMTEKDGERQALIKKIIKPQINGVVVVCDGGGDAKINERVIKTVSTVLNIASSKICVESKI